MATSELQSGPFVLDVQLPKEKARLRQEARLRLLDTILEAGLLALLIAAVLSFGAVRPWGIFGVRIGAVLLFAVWTARQLVSGEFEIPTAFLPLGLFGTWVGMQWIFGISVYRYQTGQ